MFNKIFILNAMIFLVFGCQKVTQKAAHLFDFARYKELKVQTVLELVVDKDSGYSNILIKEQKFPLKGKLRVAGQWQDIEAFRVGDESGQLLIASSEIGMPIDLVVRLPHEFSEDSVLLHFQVDIGNAAGLHLQGITGGQLESMSVAQLGIAADANPRIVLSVASSLAVALVKDKNNEIQLSKETISDFQNLVVVLRDYQKTLQDNVKRDESFSGSDYIENLFSRMATGMQSDQTHRSKIVTVLEQVTKDNTVAQETVKKVSNNTLSDKLNDTVSNTSIFVEKDKASNTEDSPDQTPPTAGGSLSFSNLAETAMTVTWPAATDNKTGQSALLYKLVRAETAAAIDTITEADAITGNSLIMDWTANTLTKNLTGLANLTSYHFAVLVKDSAGNKTLYSLNSQATLDLTAPTAGGTLSFSNIAESTLTVSWPAATDALTAQTGLSYKLVRASAAANIDTVAEADAITGASVAMDWTNQGLTKIVTGLTGLSTYHFAVLVKDAAGNKTLYPLNSQATLDQTAPVLGTAISFSSITSTSMTVSWGTASDALTSNASSLQYKLVTASNLAAIDTIAEVDAISNSSRLMNWTAGDTSESVTGLVQNTAYYFAVLVKDGSNNMTLYSPAGTSSSCGCAAGTYANSSSCVAAETGYYATSCERAACSNKPSHSTYLGDSFSSNRCAWACDNGYVANSSFTACDTNANYVPLSCGSNQLIVGITGRAGSWMDKLGVRCQVFENGALTGSISSGTEYGGNGGSAMAKDCPSGSAISEIDYGNHVGNGLNVMGRLRFRCTNLST
ncbi:MAG: hypothetical protein NTX25_20305, partial [Proteobacteria bacterium]|nr:hypothetical protein [Pseudomonadota bacterium]